MHATPLVSCCLCWLRLIRKLQRVQKTVEGLQVVCTQFDQLSPLSSLCSSLSSPLSFPLSLSLPLHTLSLLAACNLTGEIQFPKCWNCRRRPVANANAVDGAQARLAPPSVVHLFPSPPSSPIASSPSQLICCCRVVSLFLSLCMRCCRLLQLVSAFVATLS